MPMRSGPEIPSPSVHHQHQMIRNNIIHRVTDLVGDTWTLRVIGRLLGGAQRFDVLAYSLDIPRSTLSARLRLLAEQHCLERKKNATSGEAAYALTEQGRGLWMLLRQMQQWNQRWHVGCALLAEEAAVSSCGHGAPLHLCCGQCMAPAEPRAMKLLLTHRFPPEAMAVSARRARDLTSSEQQLQLSAEQLMGDRWTGLILGAAFLGVHRFSEFEQALGIATNILSGRLVRLTQQGMLERVQDSDTSERHVYRLTLRGLSYYPVIVAALAWGERWLEPHYDPGWRVLHSPCLEWFTPSFVCEQCGCAQT
ncbi:winged helix-turn-helix transcriptional regulator [Lampropedia aestuarii]|uniref:winged helix-turn-helix transcriptional regulator n=1 Tax=Lampropedia aestuarii TaxID=2562762 RepID=UPI002468631B|nr:winged helix-turn-helix transcriptional regulator [Lampropedia aestuarii]MDH5858438.1 winged helix-turn-helix transcriptional regulator [Lampropedia aestuarii]